MHGTGRRRRPYDKNVYSSVNSSLARHKDMIIDDITYTMEYIEEIAREKLGMYLPNEKVYIDIGK